MWPIYFIPPIYQQLLWVPHSAQLLSQGDRDRASHCWNECRHQPCRTCIDAAVSTVHGKWLWPHVLDRSLPYFSVNSFHTSTWLPTPPNRQIVAWGKSWLLTDCKGLASGHIYTPPPHLLKIYGKTKTKTYGSSRPAKPPKKLSAHWIGLRPMGDGGLRGWLARCAGSCRETVSKPESSVGVFVNRLNWCPPERARGSFVGRDGEPVGGSQN